VLRLNEFVADLPVATTRPAPPSIDGSNVILVPESNISVKPIDTPETQLEEVPVNVKLPLNVPVNPPVVLLFVTVVILVFVPPAIPWLNRLYATSPVSLRPTYENNSG